MPLRRLYSFASAIGTFYICAASRGYFGMLESNLLGTAATPEQMARKLSGWREARLAEGHLPGTEKFALAIPQDLQRWRKIE